MLINEWNVSKLSSDQIAVRNEVLIATRTIFNGSEDFAQALERDRPVASRTSNTNERCSMLGESRRITDWKLVARHNMSCRAILSPLAQQRLLEYARASSMRETKKSRDHGK